MPSLRVSGWVLRQSAAAINKQFVFCPSVSEQLVACPGNVAR